MGYDVAHADDKSVTNGTASVCIISGFDSSSEFSRQ